VGSLTGLEVGRITQWKTKKFKLYLQIKEFNFLHRLTFLKEN